ncbi:hypothetical protein N665_0025s0095 [Sinapis alba]|nr:hypothetical protein N665_0025s0095 [Sinapis alba]
MDQLHQRFSSWSSRALSFAGRMQLIASEIYSKINFWFSSFILPKGCIKRIQSLCSRFLWNGNVTNRAAARVSWEIICLPKKEGGLGFRDLSLWNKTLCLKLIWLIFSGSDSLWASWIRTHRIGGDCFWNIDDKKQASWVWKSLLHLRPLARRFLRCEVGNGKTASFWFDCWLSLGPLNDLFGATGPAQLGIPITSKVCNACSLVGWNLRNARSQEAEQLQIHLCSVNLPSQSATEDSYYWEVNGDHLNDFSTKITWEALRNRAPDQDWAPLIWFKGSIPSHAFKMWLAHLNRLPTRNRLVAWGVIDDDSCCICNHYRESRDHVFLRCHYSEEVWTMVLIRLGYSPTLFHTWTAFMEWLAMKHNFCPPTLKLLTVQATICKLWWERNNRLHNGISTTPHALFKVIDRQIRDAILAKKSKKNFSNLMQAWLRHD